jgi:hypothetical protein
MLTGAACAGRHVLAIRDDHELKFLMTAQVAVNWVR